MSKPVSIVDDLGQRYELVEFFDHDSQQYLLALRFVSGGEASSVTDMVATGQTEAKDASHPPKLDNPARIGGEK